MVRFNFWGMPKGRAYRKRGAAELLPELFEMPTSARRANRLLGAVALFGAFGTVALAVALTPGAQHSASKADAAQTASPSAFDATAQFTVASSMSAPAENSSEPAVLVAALPQRAAKADRLTQISWAPEAGSSEHLPDADMRGALLEAETPAETAIYGPDLELGPDLEREADSGRETGPDFALGYPELPPPGATGLEASDIAYAGDDFRVEPSAAAGDDEAAAEVPDAASAPAIDEEPAQTASFAPPAEAEAEEVKTRTAAVNSDVNMRIGPDNDAKVIKALPRNSEVEVIGCKLWCEVIHAGKRGYIYKSFIPGANS